MGCGKSTVLALRVMALIVVLGVAGVGAWSMFIIHDIQVRHKTILDNVQFGSQEMEQRWTGFFGTVLDSAIKMWISVASAAFSSLMGIAIVLATILPTTRIRSAIMIPMECVSMCVMGAAAGISLSFALNLDAFGKRTLDTSASPELRAFAVLVDLSLIYTAAAGTGWILFLITFITATVDACRRAKEKESCSFEPTASGLGMTHGYSTVLPPSVHSRPPSVYDPEMPLNQDDATATAWNSAQKKDSAGRSLEMGRTGTVMSEEARLSIGSQSSISGSSIVQKAEKSQQARPPSMAGFKRGGARGGFKKGFTNKRSSPDEDDSAPRASKKVKGDEDDDSIPVVPELKTDDNGDPFVSLNSSGKRRVTVSDFNKNTFVSIREYYVTDSGETKPGKKGISLTIDQYNALLAAAPLIESALAKKEIQVVRPDYDSDATAKSETEENREEEPDLEAETSKSGDEGEEDEE
ncbi:hypothetical protein yc1106_02320 [Curvularia clavata]|uniref:Transcriptional coactivator p15 (PC4) C-terminal domain-containing protein n=1 Tax=Curvularia clavata TaxID=95742 RepID=A0A9Q8Z347_CURCL|nr:hypothetical protein yc1106_02320 [Curvularia clavata]